MKATTFGLDGMLKLRVIVIILLLLPCTILPVFGEKFYSFVDHNGQLVFMNHKPRSEAAGQVTVHEIERDRPDIIQFDEHRYNQYDALIMKHSRETGVDFNLIKTVILVESNFNPKAVSPKGAIGLMQLIPETAERFGVSNPYDPDENIRGGATYLRYLIDLFNGNLKLVLSAYNAGENLVKRIMRIPNYRETVNYVKKIVEIFGRTHTTLADSTVVYAPGAKFYKYVDQNGVITFTNSDPPKGARPFN